MSERLVVTSGDKYIDIDAYAAIIGYAELLRRQGFDSVAVTTAPYNESIPPMVQKWPVELDRAYDSRPNDEFILLDVSDSEHFDTFVDVERVVEIIDHHPGHEVEWRDRLGDKAVIEYVGAVATQIHERWEEAGKTQGMPSVIAKLLGTAILDNTLDFTSAMTTERDKQAYRALKQLGEINDEWKSQYFAECQETIMSDLPRAIANDFKIIEVPWLKTEVCFGQLVVWNGQSVLAQRREVETELAAIRAHWFMNVVSVEERKSYFLCGDSATQQWLAELLEISPGAPGCLETDRAWLRKEVLKRHYVKLDHGPKNP